ncbi:hypothetical protein [Nocardia jiangsuensis]|uniref:Uncharacterized protein n=1 Tax=Nocardia jiangsuensis TaxID=1691563 RepID=A0ABV8DNT5_9NOCA
MLNSDFAGRNCSIARSRGGVPVGSRSWRRSSGIAGNVLVARLGKVVEHGVIEKVQRFGARDRYDFPQV